MTLSQKLDLLQQSARVHTGGPHKAYLISLLAEHAEEDEMMAEFLEWVEVLCGIDR